MTDRNATALAAHHAFLTPLALAAEGAAPEWIQIFPSGGELHASDGRRWKLADPAAVVAASLAPGIDLAIDWEHAQDLKANKGEPAPAAAWVDDLQVRGDTIFAHLRWSDTGKRSVEAREYRYFSPSFIVDKAGKVLRLIGGALVNRPAFPQLPALSRTQPNEEDMDKQVLDALGLAEGATVAEVVGAINKQKSDLAMATARAESPSPEKFIPRADYDAALARATTAEQKLAEREKTEREAEITAAVDGAVKEGKIAPASKDHYLALCRKEGGLDEFKKLVGTLPKIVNPNNLNNRTPEGQGVDESDSVALAAQARAYMNEQAKLGRTLTIADAVIAIKEGRK
jgi:phage I-like protein